jgi:hypothetical protein
LSFRDVCDLIAHKKTRAIGSGSVINGAQLDQSLDLLA